ncbi:MAG TPA: thioredoxin [Candidatus Peribacter riflensis]|uniref:Thioredoxin n=1 Tax=Candidatus Peribacter riflensis TaxID=1735162 RepID=A0A0S1SLM3_9BACT|nr:MAG: thioredoxin 1 [Candidatus Peribacter riflensis]OGJ77776.1 MAG: thioredoxin [Candidatus Peribacteria bacterium RIFOXYB1_FULL_57_12]ALM11191.1 MAG: thioredoxin 1 [Candidatus Peribacter riflensis]ALM12294.1 MAG: thioredoxin 1 [Candidatus Peribacter riflensis]ALM13396.1 MAG: thioredoxin 1 [Candidatus Peribacter riflensis]
MAASVTDATFQTEVLQSSLPVLVDFWAPWCGPCKMMGPIVDELAQEYEGKVKIVKVNVDENPETPGQFNVMSIPTFILFKGGKPFSSFIGAKPKESVKQEIDRALA